MNRLQQKCVLVSAGLHLLLVGILFIGPGFIKPKSNPENLAPLDFVPWKTVDRMISGGGTPEPKAPPAAQPPQPQTLPAPPPPVVQLPPRVVEPTPKIVEPVSPPVVKHVEPKPDRDVEKVEKISKPEPPKITKPDPDSLETKTEEKPKLPQVSTEIVERKSDSRKEAKARAEAKAREQEREEARERARQAEARHLLAERFGEAAKRITTGVSSGTAIRVAPGPGGGGVPYANFRQAVQSVYERAWIVPDGVTDNEATAMVSVTIARDGRVINARIERSSGNREVDRSVQNALDRVKYAAPLPEESKENERTVPINFNVKAKRGLG